MRSRTLSAAAAGIAALGLVAALSPVASASGTDVARTTTAASAKPVKASSTCFKNMNRRHATGVDIPSVNYDDPNSKFASQAADDFTLTAPCVVTEVDVAGTFDQQSVLDWETVYVYPDAGGKPGFPAIWVQSALKGKQGRQPGDFNIRFGPLTLQPGTYWISVQAQLQSGRWGWDNIATPSGSQAMFQNPAGGFPGCPTWTPIQTCFSGTPGPDLMFAIKTQG
jgi:hypothetical protein